MKRYIRLKNNCIIDTTKHIGYEIDDELYGIGHIVFMKKDIIKESDNILDLIQVGDLVEVHYKESEYSFIYFIDNKYFLLDYWRKINIVNCDGFKLYTKQNDNYILVWDKEIGVIL